MIVVINYKFTDYDTVKVIKPALMNLLKLTSSSINQHFKFRFINAIELISFIILIIVFIAIPIIVFIAIPIIIFTPNSVLIIF